MSYGLGQPRSHHFSLRPGQERSIPYIPAALIAGAGMIAAAAAGRYIGEGRGGVGVAIVLATAYVPLVFLDIALAIGTFAGLVFVVHLSALSVAPTAIEILIAVAWMGTGGARRGRLPVLRMHRALTLAIVLMASWLLLTTAWSPVPAKSASGAAFAWVSALTFIIVATSLTSPRDVLLVAVAFVLGAVLSSTLGLLGVGNPTGAGNVGRLTGGGGDPNAQAAGFLAAVFLAAALITVLPRRIRHACYAAVALTAVGFFATESRGGLLALVFALAVALVLLPEQRRQVLAMCAVGAIALSVWVSTTSHALKRITDFSGGGSGRTDLWTVALRIFDGHPLVGAGLNGFQALEPHYALVPGPLSQVTIVAEVPEIVHNTYLELMTETGMIGLIAFLVVVFLALRASWLASRLYDALGEQGFGNLARAVLLGEVGMLAALFFLSDLADPRLWILFGMGPVLHTLARREAANRWPAAVAGRPRRRGRIRRFGGAPIPSAWGRAPARGGRVAAPAPGRAHARAGAPAQTRAPAQAAPRAGGQAPD